MNYVTLLVIGLFFNNFPRLFIGSSDFVANLVWDISQYSLISFLCYFIFHITPKYDFKQRAIALILMLVHINLMINMIYDRFDVSIFYVQYPLGIGVFLYLIYTTLKWDIETKEIIILQDKSYFVFKKPKSFTDFICTLFKTPVSSFSIVDNGMWYKFSRNVIGLYTKPSEYIDKDYNVIVEVPKIDSKLINSLLGLNWKLRDCNCVTVFKSIFNSMDIKLGKFDFIPSIFAYKFLRGKHVL